jgi:hypothetical protein
LGFTPTPIDIRGARETPWINYKAPANSEVSLLFCKSCTMRMNPEYLSRPWSSLPESSRYAISNLCLQLMSLLHPSPLPYYAVAQIMQQVPVLAVTVAAAATEMG